MKRVVFVFYMLITSALCFSQGIDLSFVDNRFVDVKGIPVTGEYNLSIPTSTENANVRLSNGLLTSTAIYYYPSGKVKTIACYKDGKKHGEWYQFNEMGNVVVQAKFYQDKKDGVWKVWNDSGSLVMKMKYRMDSKSGVWKEWENSGHLKAKRKY